MYIPEKLKLNKFRECAIPSNREYFQRFGMTVPPEGSFSGDEVCPEPMNTIESIEDMQRYAEMKQEDVYNKNEK